MESRMVKMRLRYWRHLDGGENDMLRKIADDMEKKNHRWMRENMKYIDMLGWTKEDMKAANGDKIAKQVTDWDSRKWRQELEQKSSLEIYREWKPAIVEEDCYDNGECSRIWFEARTNTMQLRNRRRFEGGNTECILCGYENEDLEHFLLWCERLSDERRQIPDFEQPYEEDKKQIIGRYLFGGGDAEIRKEKMYVMYKKREKLSKEVR